MYMYVSTLPLIGNGCVIMHVIVLRIQTKYSSLSELLVLYVVNGYSTSSCPGHCVITRTLISTSVVQL